MLKLFIAVRCDLTPQQRTVQAAHAAVELILSSVGKPLIKEWHEKSNTMVLVGVKDERELQLTNIKLFGMKLPSLVFYEPDMGDAATALATIVEEDCPVFKKLELL